MGWSSGTELMNNIIEIIKEQVNDEIIRRTIYSHMIAVFLDQDWDTEEECLGRDKAYDVAFYELYPDYEIEENDYEFEDDEEEEL
jgi:hypothetical protein